MDNISAKKYMIFRPYIDPMTLRPHRPADKGYYFKFYNGVNVNLIRYTFEDNGFREVSDRNQEWTVSWACSNIKSQLYQSLTRNQKVNHFPAMFQITRKTYLAKNLKRLQKLFPLEYDFFPRTWIVPNEISDLKIHAENTRTKVKNRSPKKKQSKHQVSKAELETSTAKDMDESPVKVKSNDSVSGDEIQEKQKKPEKP